MIHTEMPYLPETLEELAQMSGIPIGPGDAEKFRCLMRNSTTNRDKSILRRFNALSGADQYQFYIENRADLVALIKTPSLC